MLCLLSTEQLHKADFSLHTVVVFVVVVVFTLSRPLSMRITSLSAASAVAVAVVVVEVIEVCLNGVNQTFSSV